MRPEDLQQEFAEFLEWRRSREGGAPLSRPATVEELFKEYEPIAARRSSFRSTQRCHWKNLLPFWGTYTVEELTYAKADEYQVLRLSQPIKVTDNHGGTKDGDRLTSPRTVNIELNSLRACLNWHLKRGRIPRNPLSGHPDLDVEDRRRFAISYDDFVKILRHMPTMTRIMLIFAYETGMRRDEFRLLDETELSMETEIKTVSLPAWRVKGGKQARTVVLSDLAVEVIKLALMLRQGPGSKVFTNPHKVSGNAVPKSTLGDHFRAARALAGVKGPGNQEYWIHSLRKAYGANKARAGMPIYLLMDQLGHTDPSVHFEYTRLASKENLEAVKQFLDLPRKPPQPAATVTPIKLVRDDEK